MVTTVGQVLVNDALPEQYRDYTRELGKSDADNLLTRIATDNPELYKGISARLMQLGANAAFEEGTTLSLDDTLGQVDSDRADLFRIVDQKEAEIEASDMSDEDKQDARDAVYGTVNDMMKKMTYDKALSSNNPFALQVKSKARGNQDQLSALLTSPGIYQDGKDRTLPVFIRHSYAEGLKPHEYFAASYGARKGVISSKFATRKAGYLGKMLSSAALDVTVSEDDCGTGNGIPVSADDDDNLGAVLARDAGAYKAGTVITKEVLAGIRKAGTQDLVVRSPLTCGAGQGVCSRCAGIREHGKFPEIGYHLGLNAAAAAAEPNAQSSLNTKHSGKKAKGIGQFSGFEVIKNLATIPTAYPDKATVSELDGTITKVEPAPQGGNYVYINGQRHYTGADMALLVKEGDTVEAGDQLADGVMNPADVVRLKGLGEGRRYFTERFTKAFRDSGLGVNRRNIEAVARSLVNHVQIDDDGAAGDHLPGDVVSYSSWVPGYRPRTTATRTPNNGAIGRYLEEPALHYTVGTRVTKNVADTLNKYGVKDVLSHELPVGVSPAMQRISSIPQYSNDWIARLSSSNLKSRLLEDVQHGSTSDIHGANPIPGVAKGVEFGQGYKPGQPYVF